jgi:hypothetical protein
VTLGGFNEFPPELGQVPPPEPALFINDPPPFQPCAGLTNVLGFVEVHWADLARKVSAEGYRNKLRAHRFSSGFEQAASPASRV